MAFSPIRHSVVKGCAEYPGGIYQIIFWNVTNMYESGKMSNIMLFFKKFAQFFALANDNIKKLKFYIS